MNIIMITPAPPQSRAGNRATAVRWADLLGRLEHRVTIAVDYDGRPYDLMVGLHAWRSAAAIAEFDARYPERPLIVALTGTDLYRFIHSHPDTTLRSIRIADRLVALHELAHRALPESAHAKLHVIYQSAKPLTRPPQRAKRHFDVCVVGHLRDEKDSLRTAYAVRDLPASSRMRVLHYGKAHNAQWAQHAEEEMARNPRYHWYGEVPYWRVRRAYVTCHLMVLSSRMEGGANVVSEAVVAGLPVIGSDIDGTKGLLGLEYPGYYPVGDTQGLRHQLLKAENDIQFLQQLREHGALRAPRFTPQRETDAWKALLDSLT